MDWEARLEREVERQGRKLRRRHAMRVSGASLKKILAVVARRAAEPAASRRRGRR